jgi:O-antigen ligase
MVALVWSAALLIVALWGLANPFVGLLGLLAVYFIRPGELHPVLAALHPERVLAILVLGSILLHRGKLVFPSITKRCLLFWMALFCSVPLAVWRSDALLNALDFIKILTYHVAIVSLVTTARRLRIFLATYALLVGWLAATSLSDYAHGVYYFAGEGIARATGLTSAGGNPNELGLTMVSGLPLLLPLIARGAGRVRWLALAVAAASITTVVLTGSRGSFLALIFLVGVLTLSSKHRLAWLLLAAIFLAVLWGATPAEYKQRYLSVNSLQNDESYQHRVLAWQAGWAMFKDNPLTGVGVGEFANASGMKYWPGQGHRIWLNAHSLYVQVIAELGLVGALAFAAFLIHLFRLNQSIAQRLSVLTDCPAWLGLLPRACTISVLVLLFGGYGSHDLYRPTWYMLAALSAAVQLGIAQGSFQLARAEEPGSPQEAPSISYGFAETLR